MNTGHTDNELQLDLIKRFINPIDVTILTNEVGTLKWWKDLETKMLIYMSSFIKRSPKHKEQAFKVIETVVKKLSRDILSLGNYSPSSHRRVSHLTSRNSIYETIEFLEIVWEGIEILEKIKDKVKTSTGGWGCCTKPDIGNAPY